MAIAARVQFDAMDVVLLSADLMVVSRVQGVAEQVGAKVDAVSDVSQAIDRCDDLQARLLIIDLSTASLDLDSIREFASNATRSVRIVAFGPHVHEDRLNAARAVGCDAVLSRGRFFQEIGPLLQECAK